MGFPISAFPVYGPGSDDLLDPETGDALNPKQPQFPPISIDPSMFKTSPAVERYRQVMESMPRREDYEVGKGTKIAAALAGSLMALKDPEAGIKASQQVVDRPYLDAMEDFNNKAKAAHTLAGIENAEADNLRQYMQAVETQNYHRQQSQQVATAEAGRNTRHNENIQLQTVNAIGQRDQAAAAEAGRQNRFEAGQAAADARLETTERGKNTRAKARLDADKNKTPRTPITGERRAREEALKVLSEGEFKGILNYNKDTHSYDVDASKNSGLSDPGFFSLPSTKDKYKSALEKRKAELTETIKSRLTHLTKQKMLEAGYGSPKSLTGDDMFDVEDEEEEE